MQTLNIPMLWIIGEKYAMVSKVLWWVGSGARIHTLRKEKSRSAFKLDLQKGRDMRVTLDGVHFKRIGALENGMLSNSFTEDEIKQVVWGCNGGQSPALGGFNLVNSCPR